MVPPPRPGALPLSVLRGSASSRTSEPALAKARDEDVGGWTGVPRNGNTNNRETEMPNDRQKSFLASTTGTLVRRQFIASSLALVGAPLLATGAVGQARPFPERPIRIVVPFAAGGGVDAFARLLGEKLRQKHGWATVIDNRPGANGTLGAAA